MKLVYILTICAITGCAPVHYIDSMPEPDTTIILGNYGGWVIDADTTYKIKAL